MSVKNPYTPKTTPVHRIVKHPLCLRRLTLKNNLCQEIKSAKNKVLGWWAISMLSTFTSRIIIFVCLVLGSPLAIKPSSKGRLTLGDIGDFDRQLLEQCHEKCKNGIDIYLTKGREALMAKIILTVKSDENGILPDETFSYQECMTPCLGLEHDKELEIPKIHILSDFFHVFNHGYDPSDPVLLAINSTITRDIGDDELSEGEYPGEGWHDGHGWCFESTCYSPWKYWLWGKISNWKMMPLQAKEYIHNRAKARLSAQYET